MILQKDTAKDTLCVGVERSVFEGISVHTHTGQAGGQTRRTDADVQHVLDRHGLDKCRACRNAECSSTAPGHTRWWGGGARL